jgi:hypothetical protein
MSKDDELILEKEPIDVLIKINKKIFLKIKYNKNIEYH